MFESSDAGWVVVVVRAGRVAVRRRAAARAVRRGAAARFALRLVALRLAVRLTALFFDVFLLEALRDFAAVPAAFRRFLAMRAPPGEWARVFYLIS